MRSVMLAHVYEFLRLRGSFESRPAYRVRISHKRNHRAVGGFSRIHVENFYPFFRGYGGHNRVDYRLVAPFTEIGNAFDDSFHYGYQLSM